MGLNLEKEERNKAKRDNNSSTPKLHLYNFPSKQREPLGMVTPPMQSFVSIPFEWEEAPGKPRITADGRSTTAAALPKPKAVRCLVPPPRLVNVGGSKVTNMPSPTTVLDEPFSVGRSFSSSGGRSFWGPEGDNMGRFSLSSSCRGGRCNKESRVSGVEGSMDFTNTTRRRIKRRSNSFLIVSSTSSKVLSSIYESFKQAVPWKRIPEKIRRKTS